jgi:hypothetical protein
MTKLVFAAAAAFALAVASPVTAAPGGCDDWGCGTNGTQLTGVRTQGATAPVVSTVTLPAGETVILRGCDDEWGCGENGTQLTGVRTQGAATPIVSSVTLPSGEAVVLH